MNDELPTGERLGRIERGVQRRIDARRQLARRIAGGAAAVLIVAGGVALFRPVTGALTSSSSAGGSSARGSGYGPAASAAAATVRCHGDVDRTVTVDPAALPASALDACARAERGARTSSLEGDGATATPSPSPTRTLCRAKDGSLHVYPEPTSACSTHGMRPYPG